MKGRRAMIKSALHIPRKKQRRSTGGGKEKTEREGGIERERERERERLRERRRLKWTEAEGRLGDDQSDMSCRTGLKGGEHWWRCIYSANDGWTESEVEAGG